MTQRTTCDARKSKAPRLGNDCSIVDSRAFACVDVGRALNRLDCRVGYDIVVARGSRGDGSHIHTNIVKGKNKRLPAFKTAAAMIR